MELIKFIKENENWEELLSQKPYCIKIKKDENQKCNFTNSHSVMFVYGIVHTRKECVKNQLPIHQDDIRSTRQRAPNS